MWPSHLHKLSLFCHFNLIKLDDSDHVNPSKGQDYIFRSWLIMSMVFMNRLAPVVSEARINFHVKDHNWIVIESPVPPSVPVKQSNSD